MLTNSKIALSVALVLATASAAVAAPKHPVRHQTPTVQQVPAGTYQSSANQLYMTIQDIGIRESY